jgi:phage gp29-like protein
MALLYDQFGREIQVKKQPATREIAVTTIRDHWSGYPSEGLTPQRLSYIFKEADGGNVYLQAELFEEMEEKDTHLFSELQTRKNAVLGLDYDIMPYSESAEDRKIRDFVSDCISNLSGFEDALLDMLDAIGKGYSMLEIMWGIDGASAVINDLQWIHAKKAVFYTPLSSPLTGGTKGGMWAKSYEMPRIITEAEPVNGEQMPPWKLVYHRYKARSGYDTRAGILRVCAWMYLFKNFDIKDWVAFAEVFGMPLRIGKYDTGASREDKDALFAAIRSLGSDAAGIISKNTEIEFIHAAKNTGSDNVYAALADFCNKEMSKAILGQTATTEGTPGKLGNEVAQDKVRHDLIKADSEALAKTIRFQIIRPLVVYNFGRDKPLPWFKFLYEPPEDLKMLSDVYKNLYEINYPLTVAHVSEKFKVPMPEKGEDLLDMASSKGSLIYEYYMKYGAVTINEVRAYIGLPPVPGGDKLVTPQEQIAGAESPLSMKILKEQSIGSRFTPGQQAIESLADAAMEEALNSKYNSKLKLAVEGGAVIEGITEPVKKMIEESKDFDELGEKILSAYSDMDADDLEDMLQRAIFVADMWGRYTGNEQ